MPVNGVEYDHEGLEISVPGVGQSFTITEINYNAKKPVDVPTGSHGLPRGGVTRKKFESAVDFTMARAEYNNLAEATADTGILGAEPMAISLVYGADLEEPTEDELEVKIEEIDTGSKEDESVKVKLAGKMTAIPSIAGHPVYVDPLGRAAAGSTGATGPGVSGLSPSGAPFGL